jgi:hypothetical protein
MSYHRHPPRPPEGKLSRYRAAHARAATYRRETAPALIAPIPKTDLGLEITLHLHTTLREHLDRIEVVDQDTANESHEREIREALAVVKAIKNGDVIPFAINVQRKQRSNSTISPRSKWTPGPVNRAS